MKQIFLHEFTLDELLEAIGKLLDDKLKLNESQSKKETPVYLTRKEVAVMLRVSLPTLHVYTKLGWLKAYRIGKRVLYRENEVKQGLDTLTGNKNKKYR